MEEDDDGWEKTKEQSPSPNLIEKTSQLRHERGLRVLKSFILFYFCSLACELKSLTFSRDLCFTEFFFPLFLHQQHREQLTWGWLKQVALETSQPMAEQDAVYREREEGDSVSMVAGQTSWRQVLKPASHTLSPSPYRLHTLSLTHTQSVQTSSSGI